MMEPIPSIDKAFSLVIQEERQRSLGSMLILQLSPLQYLLPRTKDLIKALLF